MAKSTRNTREREARSSDIVAFEKGERVTFPVAKGHKLARFQTLKPVRSAEDVADFMVLWEKIARARDATAPTAEQIVKVAKKMKLQVLQLRLPNLMISAGAVVILKNPLNHVSCADAVIDGDLVSQGDLVLHCQTLRA